MKQEELRDRTKAFALRLIKLYRALPPKPDAQIMGKQVLRSGTAVGANYRAASRARSRAEFAAKIGIVVEEADESVSWLELLLESEIIGEDRLSSLLRGSRTDRDLHGGASNRTLTFVADYPIARFADCKFYA